ncbi:Coenzyme F420 hydrogenase/dehydrogenase, beta subunit C-terminal domain [Helicobacter sp. T3_23-1059]
MDCHESLRDSRNDSVDSSSLTRGNSTNSPSLAEGVRGWVESLPFYFHKNSTKDSQTLSFSPKLSRFTEPKAFALKAKDDALRLNSSSGGAFTLIAQYVLNRGGVVFGASFDENLNVVHRFIESLTEMDTLRRSKYVESFIGDTYKQARDFLKAGRLVLFSGVQCQIHALNAFLRKPYPNLLTIEVICNSVPSPKIWDIYKESLRESNDEKLLDFNFRGKNLGWENYSIIATTNKEQKIIPNAHSPYLYNAWATHIITRKSCGNCYSKGFVSGADFTLGDFWGIREYHADFVDELGVSCVFGA